MKQTKRVQESEWMNELESYVNAGWTRRWSLSFTFTVDEQLFAMEIIRNKICNVIIIIEVSSRNWMCTLLFVYICIPSTELKLNSFCICSQRGEAQAEAASTKANQANQANQASNAKTMNVEWMEEGKHRNNQSLGVLHSTLQIRLHLLYTTHIMYIQYLVLSLSVCLFLL